MHAIHPYPIRLQTKIELFHWKQNFGCPTSSIRFGIGAIIPERATPLRDCIVTFDSFVVGRTFEQIKINVAFYDC